MTLDTSPKESVVALLSMHEDSIDEGEEAKGKLQVAFK